MAKKTNLSPDTNPARTTAPAAKSAPKHRRAKTTVAETAPGVAAKVAEETAKPAAQSRGKAVKQAVPPDLPVTEPAAVPQEPAFTITHDDIATLAFSYWERRGYQGGSPDDDWRLAEEELLSLLR